MGEDVQSFFISVMINFSLVCVNRDEESKLRKLFANASLGDDFNF